MFNRIWLIALAFVCGMIASVAAHGQVADNELPEAAKGVEVVQKLGASLPLDLRFHDESNRYVRLSDYFQDDKPVLLSFNYSDCPKLCSIQLQNLSRSLQDINLKPGKDFDIVIVSIDPNEQLAKARELKATYLAQYGDLSTEDGWHVLKGEEDSIKFLADSCGYHYKYIPRQKRFAHPSAFIFCSADGRIIRYLDGLDGDLRFKIDKALVEAGEGKTGSILQKVMYFSSCYVFDEYSGKYSIAMMGIMRWGAGITVFLLVVWLVPTWILKSRNKNSDESEDKSDKNIIKTNTEKISPNTA